MKNVIVRSLSGIVYIALIVGAILAGKVWFVALLTVFAVVAMAELLHDLDRGTAPKGWAPVTARVLDLVVAAVIVTLPLLLSMPFTVMLLDGLLIFCYTLLRFILALYDKTSTALVSTARSLLAQAYICFPLMMLGLVYCDNKDLSKYLVLCMFILIWLNDTGAFCVGSTLGKHRLFERLSPKKSWEGFFGGLAFCLLASWLFYSLKPEFGASLPEWLIFGALVCILSTYGDLFESMIKRTIGIKDSGHLIPGHGGILDRIDSLLFVSIGTAAFYLLSFSWL